MSVGDRMEMLHSDQGRQLLSSLTPSQLADMFPDYYKKQYPDVGKLLLSISDPRFKGAEYTREQADRFMDRDRATYSRGDRSYREVEKKPSWVRKFEEETGKVISDTSAKAELSQEKKDLLKEMEVSGGIKLDDPRVKFLENFSEAELKEVGIIKKTDPQGGTVYGRSEISDEEIKAKLETTGDAKIEAIRKTILGKESSGNYGITSFAEGRGSTASGGYQFANGTWQEQARKAGYDPSKYPRAKDAPPEIQDAVARSYIKDILRRNNGDIAAVPREWYAGPKGYLTENELRVNRGMTVDKYMNDWMSRYKVNAKGIESPASIAQSFEDAKKQIVEDQQSRLASKIEVPILPEGLKPEVVSFYDTLTARQKQDFYSMLTAAGGGKTPEKLVVGVNRMNEIYDKNPSAIQQGVFKGNGKLLFSDPGIEAGVSQLNPNMQGTLSRFQEIAPRGTTITSTYRGADHPIEARKRAPGAHSRGSAIDIRTEGKSPEELQQTIQALKRAGFTKVLLEGNPPHIHAESNPGQDFHITNLGRGNPHIDLASAREVAKSVKFNDVIIPQETTATAEKKQEQPPKPTVAEQPVAEQTEELRKKQEIASTTTQEEPNVERVEVYAEGGQEPISAENSEIKAMPIDSLKGDNSVVVDGQNKPLFTMNTKEEQAVYNPKTRQVDVQPLTKTNPDKLGEKQTTETMAQTQDTTSQEMRPTPTQQSPLPSSEPRSGDVSINITEDLIKDPSFKRAIAKTRFVDTGDHSLGGHFGMANADLG